MECMRLSEGACTLSVVGRLSALRSVRFHCIPIEDVVTVSLDLTVVYVILAIAGMAFAVACLAFTLIFRERRYMCTLCVWCL